MARHTAGVVQAREPVTRVPQNLRGGSTKDAIRPSRRRRSPERLPDHFRCRVGCDGGGRCGGGRPARSTVQGCARGERVGA